MPPGVWLVPDLPPARRVRPVAMFRATSLQGDSPPAWSVYRKKSSHFPPPPATLNAAPKGHPPQRLRTPNHPAKVTSQDPAEGSQVWTAPEPPPADPCSPPGRPP